jgi:hypothetical protein
MARPTRAIASYNLTHRPAGQCPFPVAAARRIASFERCAPPEGEPAKVNYAGKSAVIRRLTSL